MFVISLLVSSFLFASAVLADRRREHRQSRFLDHVKQPANTAHGVEYNDIWAGAVWEKYNGAFTSITGTFTVPMTVGQNGSAPSAWVGISGDTCSNGGLFQAGVDFNVNADGVIYDAWYEWFPGESYYFDDLSISAGDVIRSTVVALSKTSGIAVVESLTSAQRRFAMVNSTSELCGETAEWIVEDFEDGNGKVVPFANFSTVTFKDGLAIGPAGAYTPNGATVVSIEQNNKILTSVSFDGSSITIKYV